MAKQNLFAMLNVARRQLKEVGLESESRFMVRHAYSLRTMQEVSDFISAYLDMVLAPLPTAPHITEDK